MRFRIALGRAAPSPTFVGPPFGKKRTVTAEDLHVSARSMFPCIVELGMYGYYESGPVYVNRNLREGLS